MLIRRDRRSRSVRTVNMLCFVGVTCFNTEQCCYLLQVFCNVCKWASTAHATRLQQHLNACLHPTPGMAGLLEVESSDSQPDQGLSHGQSSLTASSLADSQNDSHVGLENGPPGPAAVKDESSSQTTPKGSKGVLFSRMFFNTFLGCVKCDILSFSKLVGSSEASSTTRSNPRSKLPLNASKSYVSCPMVGAIIRWSPRPSRPSLQAFGWTTSAPARMCCRTG